MSPLKIARFFPVLLLVGALALMSCGPATTSAPAAAPATAAPQPVAPTVAPAPEESAPAPTFSAEDVGLVAALAKMEGHLRVSLPLWEAGKYDLAAAHASHPAAELWNIVADGLKAKNADSAVKGALDTYAGLAGGAGDAAKVKAANEAAIAALKQAEPAIAGEAVADPAFQSAVIHALLEEVEHEYAEAVSNGQVVELIEYQDAMGFLTVAQERFAMIEATVKAGHPHEYEEIEEHLEALKATFPDVVTPPAQPSDPAEVEVHVDKIVTELGEVFPAASGAPVVQAVPDPVADPVPEGTREARPDPVADPEPEATTVVGPTGGEATGQRLTIYSGRSEELVRPIIERFAQETGIQVEVRWGNTPELAALLMEEGTNTPADLFFAQDPGALGAVAGMMAPLPGEILNRVDARFRDPQGRWVGISGRARVVVYNTERVRPEDLPADLSGFTDPKWKGRIGWAPTNSSFQTMVTAMRVLWGEAKTREWLEGILANDPKVYPSNTPIVAATGAGEVDVGFVNHYYLFRFLAEEGEDSPARNYHLPGGGPGSLVMVAGTGILAASQHQDAAREFVAFLLSQEAQQYFADQTFEYPLVEGVQTHAELQPLKELTGPQIDLADLADLPGTAQLLSEVGALP